MGQNQQIIISMPRKKNSGGAKFSISSRYAPSHNLSFMAKANDTNHSNHMKRVFYKALFYKLQEEYSTNYRKRNLYFRASCIKIIIIMR